MAVFNLKAIWFLNWIYRRKRYSARLTHTNNKIKYSAAFVIFPRQSEILVLTTPVLQKLYWDAVLLCLMFFCVLLPLETEISPREKEDLELLERALEKAFCVRTGAGHPAKEPNKQSAPPKDPRTSAVPPREGRQTLAAPSSKQTNRITSKYGRLDRKEQKKTGASVAVFAWTPVSRLPEDQMFPCTQRKLNVHMPAILDDF